jgi:hypothetical protein
MPTLNLKNNIFSSFYSMKAGDEVSFAPPSLNGRLFRFHAIEGIPSTPTSANVEFGDNVISLSIPLLSEGERALEIDRLYQQGPQTISARIILKGAGEFTLVFVELFEYTGPY